MKNVGGRPSNASRAPGFVPLCMVGDDLARWTALSEKLPAAQRPPSPCSDCRLAFAVEMRAIDRCNGSPGRGS